MTGDALVRVVDLVKHFEVRGRSASGGGHAPIRAVDGVTFEVNEGEILALVGESGSGKTTVVRTVVGLYTPTSGHVYLAGTDVSVRANLARHRRDIQFVPQNPLSALNRRRSILHALAQPLSVYGVELSLSRDEQYQRARQYLSIVGLPDGYLDRFPSALSVGELQRVAIARGLILEPRLLLLDEPTASVDVSTKARLINLFLGLRRRMSLTAIFVTHEMDVARHISDRIAVMYQGKIVEVGDTARMLREPQHPYTRKLLEAAALRS